MRRPSWSYKLGLLALFSVAYGFFYLLPNFRPLFEPVFLPLLPVDQLFPLVPWTFLIYLSDYLLFAATFLLINDGNEWNAFSRMAFATLFLCGMCFLLFPTTYPRPPYPEVDNALVAFAMNLIAVGDTPNNCFPSMHVAMTSVALWNLRRLPRPYFLFFLLWSVSIFVSTLTTKQHYFVDILGGLGVTTLVAWLDWGVFTRGWLQGKWLPARLPRD